MMSICDLVLGLQNQLLSYFALAHDGISHIQLCHCYLDLWLCQIMDLLFYNFARCRWGFCCLKAGCFHILVYAVGHAGVSHIKMKSLWPWPQGYIVFLFDLTILFRAEYFVFMMNAMILCIYIIYQCQLSYFNICMVSHVKEALATILTKNIICFGNW
jgi:hypothetical protein